MFSSSSYSAVGKSYFYDVPRNIIINVKDRNKIRYLQLLVTIEVKDNILLPILSVYSPVIRNEIIFLLSDLKLKEAKNKILMKEYQEVISTHLNKLLPEYDPTIKIEKVLFASMVVQ